MGRSREPFFAKATKGRRAVAIHSAMTVSALVGVGADGWEDLGCVKRGLIGRLGLWKGVPPTPRLRRTGGNALPLFLCCCEVEVAGGSDRRGWEFFVFGQAVFDFVADGDTEVGVGFFLPFPVADAAVKEIGAVADVALVFVRPFDEAEVTVCGFHGGNLVFWFGFGNDFGDLALLVGFGIGAFRSG